MRMIAFDTLNISSATPSHIAPGAEFTINKHEGEDLARRELAKEKPEKGASSSKKKSD